MNEDFTAGQFLLRLIQNYQTSSSKHAAELFAFFLDRMNIN